MAGLIGRITPSGTVTEFPGLTAGSAPRGIAAGPDGNLWFTEFNNPGRIGRITPGPGAQTGAASDVGTTTATPAGTLRPNGQPATCRFRYEANTGFQHLGPPP